VEKKKEGHHEEKMQDKERYYGNVYQVRDGRGRDERDEKDEKGQ
jgi:hypothetical protein